MYAALIDTAQACRACGRCPDGAHRGIKLFGMAPRAPHSSLPIAGQGLRCVHYCREGGRGCDHTMVAWDGCSLFSFRVRV